MTEGYAQKRSKDDMIGRDDIKLLNVDYEDIQAWNNLNPNNVMRCGKLIKNCVLQNVFKIFNWWSQR